MVNSSESSDCEEPEAEVHHPHHPHPHPDRNNLHPVHHHDPFTNKSVVGSDVVDELLKPLQSYFNVFRTGLYENSHNHPHQQQQQQQPPVGTGGNGGMPHLGPDELLNGRDGPPAHNTRSHDKRYKIKKGQSGVMMDGPQQQSGVAGSAAGPRKGGPPPMNAMNAPPQQQQEADNGLVHPHAMAGVGSHPLVLPLGHHHHHHHPHHHHPAMPNGYAPNPGAVPGGPGMMEGVETEIVHGLVAGGPPPNMNEPPPGMMGGAPPYPPPHHPLMMLHPGMGGGGGGGPPGLLSPGAGNNGPHPPPPPSHINNGVGGPGLDVPYFSTPQKQAPEQPGGSGGVLGLGMSPLDRRNSQDGGQPQAQARRNSREEENLELDLSNMTIQDQGAHQVSERKERLARLACILV